MRAAGGLTRTLDGQPLAYGKRKQAHDSDFANPHFVASAVSPANRVSGHFLGKIFDLCFIQQHKHGHLI
jgi:hypothetical protein